MRCKIYILVWMLCSLFPTSVFGKKGEGKVVELTTEQKQQFTYYWYAARQAITEERYADAYSLLQFCHALNPNDAQTLTFLGVLYQGVGDEERAKEAYKRAYELSPADCWQHYLEPLKQQYIDQQNWKKAIQTQDEIDTRKGEYDAYSALTRYRIYAMWNKPKTAIEAIDRYLETDPANVRFLLFRIELAEQTNAKKKELYALYERVLEIDPYNMAVLNNYAYHLATHGGDLSKAEQMSQITIRTEPNNPTCLDTYGWIMHLKGQDDLAQFYLQKALWNATDEENKAIIQEHIKIVERQKTAPEVLKVERYEK